MKNETFIGQLNERITIKSVVPIKSETSGAETKQLEVLKPCWAKVQDVSGTEETNGRVIYVNTKEFIVRFDERLTGPSATEKEIEYDGENYEVVSVLKIGRKIYLKIKGIKCE